ncbi:HesB/YadR/YfhF family protein [Paenibacillus sp. YPG26]|uniref:HesB/YadR/YfhF family protein n=1 Tax=Paenibacillus sp. YPG26 TaxID=2878915 RepID=UPI00203DEBE4|nr:HesB/YadR/YfhF family protein [Paenibacillus sp. YPG26]USB35087.1 HesB/YadR/YfhF family protein [Paenibacillus sp. YPG26]
MMIHVTDSAAKWYKKELELQEGQAIRFFVRYSAGGHIHPGFSLGIGVEDPGSPGYAMEAEGINFYMEEQDMWYLEGYDLKVTYEESSDDIAYEYVKAKVKTA